MKHTGRIITIAVVILLLALGIYSHCRNAGISGTQQYISIDSGYREVMGTFARIVAVGTGEKKCKEAITAAMQKIRRVDELMSDYKENSEISQVNRLAHHQPVKVSKDTFEVLRKSIEFSRLTDGAFDVTVGPIVDLWRSAGEANSVPTEHQLELARSKVGYDKLILDANNMSVKFKVEGMRIDLGGIAKGYAIDKTIQTLKQKDLIGGMLDIGGDVRCFGKPDKKREKWLVGIQDPDKTENWPDKGAISLALEVSDMAVATSGSYRRFYLIKGQKQSHIINTRTATATKGPTSVTIIAPEATDADALATAVSVMGAEKGLELIEQLRNTEAVIITTSPEQKLIKTGGAHKFIK